MENSELKLTLVWNAAGLDDQSYRFTAMEFQELDSGLADYASRRGWGYDVISDSRKPACFIASGDSLIPDADFTTEAEKAFDAALSTLTPRETEPANVWTPGAIKKEVN